MDARARSSSLDTARPQLLQNADDASAQSVQLRFFTAVGVEADERRKASDATTDPTQSVPSPARDARKQPDFKKDQVSSDCTAVRSALRAERVSRLRSFDTLSSMTASPFALKTGNVSRRSQMEIQVGDDVC